MALKVVHTSVDQIPEPYRELYSERDGKWVLTGIEGVKTSEDVDRVTRSLESERAAHKETKTKLAEWDGLETEDVKAKLDRMPELELAAKGAGTQDEIDKKLEEMAEARARTRLAPVEREKKALEKKLADLDQEANALRVERKRRLIHDDVRAALREAKVRTEAEADALMLAETVCDLAESGKALTKENPFGVAPGLGAVEMIEQLRDHRPHWWPESKGGGAGGSGSSGGAGGGANPWHKDTYNRTEQMRLLQTNPERAKQLAASVGATI